MVIVFRCKSIRRFFGLAVMIFFFQSWPAKAVELEFLSQVSLLHKTKYKKTIVGGLSGLFFDASKQILFAVSDDRGNLNEPRIYQFQVSISGNEMKLDLKDVIILSVNRSESAHQSTKSSSRLFSKVLDLEGISVTPWGDFLLINEGDMNRKPRVFPQVFSAKSDGTIAKSFEVPDAFLPELTGEQKKGVRNNLAFEGLAVHPNNKEWLVSTEGSLKQDADKFIRWIKYSTSEAWVLKPQNEYRYPVETSAGGLEFQKGISELHFINDQEVLVLERAVQLGPGGLGFAVQIYRTDLSQTGKEHTLTRKPVLDLATLKDKIGKLENFEGMTIGPRLSDGRRSLILVSDDNFMRDQRTQFLLFAIKE
jgi:hypothetical protein